MRPLRFNHMELTMPRGALDAARDDIRAFYGEVFGWRATDQELFGQRNLVLICDDSSQQFILLMETDDPMQSPGYDHLGLHCDTREQVDEIRDRCERYRERDDRVRLKHYDDLVTPPATTHAFYVRYLLPIWFDVQCITYDEGRAPRHRWRFD